MPKGWRSLCIQNKRRPPLRCRLDSGWSQETGGEWAHLKIQKLSILFQWQWGTDYPVLYIIVAVAAAKVSCADFILLLRRLFHFL